MHRTPCAASPAALVSYVCNECRPLHVFALAHYLRLAPPRQRDAAIESDLERLADAVRRWTRDHVELDVVVGDAWIAWRPSPERSVATASTHEYDHWRIRSDQAITFWPKSPFREYTPEFVAALTVLNRFREGVLAADPGGNPHARLSDEQVDSLVTEDDALEGAVRQSLEHQADLRVALLKRVGLADLDIEPLRTEAPQVNIWVADGRPMYQLSRGGDEPSVTRVTEAPEWFRGERGSLASLLTPQPEAAVYERVIRAIESELGCRVGAQSWSHGELVRAWAW